MQERKKSYFRAAALTVFYAVLTGIVGIFVWKFYRSDLYEETEKESYDKYYVMITENSKSSFWQSVYQGAFDRGIEENVYVDWLGDNLLQEYSRDELMEIAISSGVDGIIVTADETPEMTGLINQASDAQIPVITLYGDNTQSERCSFVGVGSYNLGREYGRQALKAIDEKRKNSMNHQANKAMRVEVLVNAYEPNLDQNILCASIQETIEQEKDTGEIIEVTLLPVDDTNAFSVEETIRDIFMEKDLPDVIICLNELDTTCVYQAVVDYNKVGEVDILGYYDSDTIIHGIERNVIYATVAVDTRQMGQFCVDALQEYYELGNTSQYFTADVTLIQKDNVEEYCRKKEEQNETE